MLRVTCHECNATLYESQELQPLDAILEGLGYQCPKCNRKIPNPAKPKQILINGKEIKAENTRKPRIDLKGR